MITTGRYGTDWLSASQVCFFREPDQGHGVVLEDQEEHDRGESKKTILCRKCHSPVTSEDERLNVLGKHRHAFPNPEGIVFEIGCFGLAPGCLRKGRTTAKYSWFPPYSWSFAMCRSCQNHLGWFYEAAGKPAFFGLILDRLIEESD